MQAGRVGGEVEDQVEGGHLFPPSADDDNDEIEDGRRTTALKSRQWRKLPPSGRPMGDHPPRRQRYKRPEAKLPLESAQATCT
jgi:hypothetical protein